MRLSNRLQWLFVFLAALALFIAVTAKASIREVDTMLTLQQLAVSVAAVGSIGGGALALDRLHVPAAQFEQYIQQQAEADQAEYVLALKKQIREVRQLLMLHPEDSEYLEEELLSLIDELCLVRPEDRACTE